MPDAVNPDDKKPAPPAVSAQDVKAPEKTPEEKAVEVKAAAERLAVQQEADRKAAAQKALNKDYLEAAKKGNLKDLKGLLDKGAELLAHDDGNTALFYAAQYGRMDAVLFLIQKGIPVDVKNRINSTPLMGAAGGGHKEVAQLLYDLGSEPAYKNMCDLSALSYARSAGYTDMREQLLRPRNVDEVSFTRPAGDMTLQEIFNFAHKDRLTVIRRGDDGPVQAIQRDSFDDLADKSQLRKAFDTYRKKGGKLPETDFFPAPPVAPAPESPKPRKRWWRS